MAAWMAFGLTTLLGMKDDETGDSAEEVFAQIGVTLLVVQQFELLVERSLKFIFADRTDITPEKIFQEDKRSLGLLISDLRKRASMTAEADRLLLELLEDRNLFAHRLRHQEWFDPHTKNGRDSFWDFMKHFHLRLDIGVMLFSAILFRHAEGNHVDPEFFQKLQNHEFYQEVRSYYPDVEKIKKRA
jgi:hypothetical protein